MCKAAECRVGAEYPFVHHYTKSIRSAINNHLNEKFSLGRDVAEKERTKFSQVCTLIVTDKIDSSILTNPAAVLEMRSQIQRLLKKEEPPAIKLLGHICAIRPNHEQVRLGGMTELDFGMWDNVDQKELEKLVEADLLRCWIGGVGEKKQRTYKQQPNKGNRKQRKSSGGEEKDISAEKNNKKEKSDVQSPPTKNKFEWGLSQ